MIIKFVSAESHFWQKKTPKKWYSHTQTAHILEAEPGSLRHHIVSKYMQVVAREFWQQIWIQSTRATKNGLPLWSPRLKCSVDVVYTGCTPHRLCSIYCKYTAITLEHMCSVWYTACAHIRPISVGSVLEVRKCTRSAKTSWHVHAVKCQKVLWSSDNRIGSVLKCNKCIRSGNTS